MRWLLSGGTGMIGQALTVNLRNDDHQVTVLSRNPKSGSESIQWVKWDGITTEGWGHLMENTDVVVNMAGERIAGPNPITFRWTAKRKKRICDSRANAGKALVLAIENTEHKPGVLIQFSGADYYPSATTMATEDTSPGQGFLAHVCAECWEPSTQSVEKMGVRRVVARLGPVLHIQDGALPPMITQTKFLLGGPLGSGKQYFSWVHIDDVVSAIRFLVDNPNAVGAYNLTAPNPVTNAEFAQTLAGVMKRPSFLRVPSIMLKMLFGEMASTLLQGPRVYPEKLLADGYIFQFAEAEEALTNLFTRQPS